MTAFENGPRLSSSGRILFVQRRKGVSGFRNVSRTHAYDRFVVERAREKGSYGKRRRLRTMRKPDSERVINNAGEERETGSRTRSLPRRTAGRAMGGGVRVGEWI